MEDWTPLGLPRNPVRGDETATEDAIQRLNRQAAEAKELATKLNAVVGKIAELRMQGDYAETFVTMLEELPHGPEQLGTAYQHCAEALTEYQRTLTEANQQARSALRLGTQSDVVYRNALQQFCVYAPMSFSGPGVWRGLTEAHAAYAPANRYRPYLVQLGRAARMAEQERQQARQSAITAGERNDAAARTCASRIENCRAQLNPGMQQAHQNLLAILNGNDAAAEKYLNIYYDAYVYGYRRKRGRPLFQGHEVPEIERDSDGFFRPKNGKEPAIPSKYHLDSGGKPLVTRGRRDSVQRNDDEGIDLDTLDQQARLRGGYLKDRAEIIAALADKPVPGSRWGTIKSLIKEDRFGHLASVGGEEFGEYASKHAMADLAKGLASGYTMERVKIMGRDVLGKPVEITGGPGRFDLIYRVTGPDGRAGFVVAEAKAPTAALGARWGLDGKRYEQGHIEYMRSVIAEMKGDNRFESLALELEKALQSNKVDYFLVRAAAKYHGGGIPDDQFTAAKVRELHDEARAARDWALDHGWPEKTAWEIRERVLSVNAYGVHTYDGYYAKQFNLGYSPVVSFPR